LIMKLPFHEILRLYSSTVKISVEKEMSHKRTDFKVPENCIYYIN